MTRIKLPKLPKIVKTKWVKALKSGKYVQTTGSLYKGESEDGKYMMCCLGVLEHACGTPLKTLLDSDFTNELEKPNSPDVLRDPVGNARLEQLFSTFNDTEKGKVSSEICGRKVKKKTFGEIAGYIERHL